jgi:hypothetical protein
VKEKEEIRANQEAQDVPTDDKLRPVKGRFKRILSLGCSIAVGGVVVVLLAPTFTPTAGATRSARLKFERRNAEIERALQEHQRCGYCTPTVEEANEKTND